MNTGTKVLLRNKNTLRVMSYDVTLFLSCFNHIINNLYICCLIYLDCCVCNYYFVKNRDILKKQYVYWRSFIEKS